MKGCATLAAALFAASPASAQLKPVAPSDQPGLVRVWGNAQLEPVVRRWVEAFRARNPGVRITINLTGSDVALAGLYTDEADIALIGREARPSEKQAFEWVHRYPLSAAEVMTGSASVAGKSPALAVLVHRSNPLRSISFDQLRAVFAGDATAIRTWDGLGLNGAWYGRPIRLYAPHAESGTGNFFRLLVLGGSNRLPWDRLTEFAEPVIKGPHVDRFGGKIAAAAAEDAAGIAIGNLGDAGANLRPVPIAAPGRRPMPLTVATVRDRRYPFARTVYAYLNRENGKPVDSDEAAFLAFVLSPEGQRIGEQAGYLARCPVAGDVSAEIKPQPYVAVPAPLLPLTPCDGRR